MIFIRALALRTGHGFGCGIGFHHLFEELKLALLITAIMYTVLALIAANGDITPTGDDGNAFKESAHEAGATQVSILYTIGPQPVQTNCPWLGRSFRTILGTIRACGIRVTVLF